MYKMYFDISPNSIETVVNIKSDLMKCNDEYLFSNIDFIRSYIVYYQ